MPNKKAWTIGMLFLFVFLIIAKQINKPKKGSEFIFNDIHIPKKPCIAAMNSLFENMVDSVKLCDCLVPNFYDLIKHDTELVQKFKNSDGIFQLNGNLQDSFSILFSKCIKSNVLDSTRKLIFSPEIKNQMKSKFAVLFSNQANNLGINADTLSDCIVEKLNGKITLIEYLAEDYTTVPVINEIIENCVSEALK